MTVSPRVSPTRRPRLKKVVSLRPSINGVGGQRMLRFGKRNRLSEQIDELKSQIKRSKLALGTATKAEDKAKRLLGEESANAKKQAADAAKLVEEATREGEKIVGPVEKAAEAAKAAAQKEADGVVKAANAKADSLLKESAAAKKKADNLASSS